MDEQVKLEALLDLDAPAAAEAGQEPVATANKAVPFMWLGLFNYDEAKIKRTATRDTFVADTTVAQAQQRSRALLEAIPADQPAVKASAEILVRELKKRPPRCHLTLRPQEVLQNLRPDQARSYLKQLINLCDLWEGLRGGLPWAQAYQKLQQTVPDIDAIVAHDNQRVARYYLIGSLADKTDNLEDLLIREGQGEKDVQPEALAVGEQGLLLGRFAGAWKLMSSGVNQDLHDIWAEDDLAYLVGEAGTVIKLEKGRCVRVEVPTKQHLKGVWGASRKSVCAVGDNGTVIAFNGKEWNPWPVPSQVSLHCICGTGTENIFIGGQDAAVLKFDGYGWNRYPLPQEGMANQLCSINETMFAVGGSTRGGEVFSFGRDGWVLDASFPRVDWLSGIWSGWDQEFGVVPGNGPALRFDGTGWSTEEVAVERLERAHGGAIPMAVGTSGKYSVILARTEAGWRAEASLLNLRLLGVWVVGSPKPPRMKIES